MKNQSGILGEQTDLPSRIVGHLANAGAGKENFVIAFKTDFKPNATIPMLWFVLHRDSVTLCNTHKTRGIYKRYLLDEINSVRVVKGTGLNNSRIDLISSNLDDEDFCLPLLSDIDLDTVKNALRSVGVGTI